MSQYPGDFINKIICGDCLEVMKEMPAGSIDMCMTSPPYWGLRDYGNEQIFGGDADCEHEWIHKERIVESFADSGTHWKIGKDIKTRKENPENWKKEDKGSDICSKCNAWKGQLGLEPTPELYIEHMTAIFHEVKRVLKKEGTLWLNIGDTYYNYRGKNNRRSDKDLSRRKTLQKDHHNIDARPNELRIKGMTEKCLCMIPERLAWSLIQDGWILRNKIVWHKPNGMPSSVKDRFTNKWEIIYMFNKNNKPILWQHKKTKEWVYEQPLGTRGKEGIDWGWKEDKKVSLWHGFTYYFDLDAVRESHTYPDRKYNPDTTKHVTYKLKENGNRTTGGLHDGRTEYAHPLGKNPGDVFEIPTQPFPEAHFAVFPEKLCKKPIKAGCPEGGTVLDPFCGAGTTLYVAKQLRRKFIGIDIKAEYCGMSDKRLIQGVL